jgi:CBS domain-containing protein
MLVQQILNAKPSAETVTIAPSATVAEASKLMTEKRIGAVVISGDGATPEGMLSERDIVRELARQGGGCLTQPVSEYMTREVQTCTRATSAGELLSRMTDGRFRHMPVVEAGALVGMVSIGDVVKAQLAELSMEKDALEGMIKGF